MKSVEQYFPVVYLLLCTRCVLSHSGQTHDACVVPGRHNFTKENTDKCRKFHFSRKILLRACVQNEVNGIHKFYRREICFIGTFYASFSYELCARMSLN